MSDIKMSTCCSCGFQWPTGQHGEHSCSSYLQAENTNLKARIVELEGSFASIIETRAGAAPNIYRLGTIYDIATKALEQTV